MTTDRKIGSSNPSQRALVSFVGDAVRVVTEGEQQVLGGNVLVELDFHEP
ncbi:MAG: hypothetical protein ACRDYX_23850 [Egibacteraceae bacterium]